VIVVWWGTRPADVRRGVVAEACSNCGTVRSFWVWDHFLVAHLMEITTGIRFVGSSLICFACRKQIYFHEERYLDVLSTAELQELTLEQGLRRTNLRIKSQLELLDQLRAVSASDAYRSRPRDREDLQSVTDSFERLVYRALDLEELRDRLARWDALDDEGRKSVIAAVRELESA